LQLNKATVIPHPALRDKQESELTACVRRAIKQYFKDLDGEPPAAIYDMVVAAVEKPLIEEVLTRADGNQTRAAEWLGITRTTLRKKLAEHDIAP
jgi:Fis family transcriptional regulator